MDITRENRHIRSDQSVGHSRSLFALSLAAVAVVIVVSLHAIHTTNAASQPRNEPPVNTAGGTGGSAQEEPIGTPPLEQLLASDGTSGAFYGVFVAMSGDTAIVGAYTARVGVTNNQGAAYVFVLSGGNWVQQQKLAASDGAAGSGFGQSVSISGDTAIIGAPGANAAYVFQRNGGVWVQQQRLTAGVAGDSFGENVAISGDNAVVGAPLDDVGSSVNQGSSYFFRRNGGVWSEVQSVTSGAANLRFGESSTISGDTAVIGHPGDTIGGNANQGSAYVYTFNGAGWALQQKLTAFDGGLRHQFGVSASISGDTMVVGSWGALFASPNPGAAYVFVRNGAAWALQQKLTAPDGVINPDGAGDQFGLSVSLAGDSIVVGAVNDTVGGNIAQGSAYTFSRSGNTWTFRDKLVAPDGSANDIFGQSVGISDSGIIVGVPQDDVGANSNQGSVYVIDRCEYALRDSGEGSQCESEIIVNTTGDEPDADLEDDDCDVDENQSGNQCTLRAAIQTANDLPGPDTITFNIPGGGVRTISPASALPDITSKVTIDGTTQPGYVDKPMIEVSGAGSIGDYGLLFASGSNTSEVRGLTVNRFSSAAIKLDSNGNIVRDCFIGLLADGNSVDLTRRQNTGIEITGSGNRIGSDRTQTRASNIITGSEFDQVLIRTATAVNNVIAGNNIGLFLNDEPQTMTTFNGVTIEDGASNNTVGGPRPEDGNDIGYFFSYGVFLGTDATSNTVRTNLISGNSVGVGIVKASNNTIGGEIGDLSNLTRNAIGVNDVGIFVGDNPNDEERGTAPTEISLETKRQRLKWHPSRTGVARSHGSILTQNNKIQGNIIGLTRSLADFGNEIGIDIRMAQNTEVGTGVSGFHNFIGGNIFEGVLIEKQAAGTKVRGNFIGVDQTGTTIKANRDGIINAANATEITNNVVSGNNEYGIAVTRNLDTDPVPTGNLIDNNRIGIKGDGTIAIPNDESGILIEGTATIISNNVISGNTRYAIDIRRNGNTLRDNRIGTNNAGEAALPNGEGGIFISSSNNTIHGNTISGNTGAGLTISRDATVSTTPPANNIVVGNFIGTNISGTAALPNTLVGIVLVDGSNNNTIGGTEANTRNVISGNGFDGINIQVGVASGAIAPSNNKIQGNYIGTNADGSAAIPNGRDGIALQGALTTLIGGITTAIPAGRNVVSGNTRNGIALSNGAAQNRISGNYVGVGANGITALGNAGTGIRVGNSCSNTTIGGPEENSGNTIGYNGGNGISLTSDAGNNNIIDPNSIFGNGLAGIDIGENGFTPNDPADADVGPNKLQNYPTFTLSIVGGDLIMSYQVDSALQHSNYGTNGIYVEFFEADATGAGRDFLGSDHYPLSDYQSGTPGTRLKNLGNAAALGIVSGDRITATATDAEGNSSEFTPAVVLAGPPVTISGRVTTPTGLGLRNALVSLIGPDGSRRIATTSSFGIYSFGDVPSGVNYTISVSSKRYRFSPRVQVINESLSNLDFVGLE